MPDDLARMIEADLGPLLAPLVSVQERGLAASAARTFCRVAAARRRKFSVGSAGAYVAAALSGIAVGIAFVGYRGAVGTPDAMVASSVGPPANLQLALNNRVDAHRSDLLPSVSAPQPTEQPIRPGAAPPVRASASTMVKRRQVVLSPGALQFQTETPPVAGPASSIGLERLQPPIAAPGLARPLAPEPVPEQPCDQRCLAFRLDDADQALAAAYQEARRAGVPPRELRARGRVWEQERRAAAALSGAAMLEAFQFEREQLAAITDAWRRRTLE